jgi:outer membrane protein
MTVTLATRYNFMKIIAFGVIILIVATGGEVSAQAGTGPASPDSAFSGAVAGIEGSPLRLADAEAAALTEATQVRDAKAALLAARGSLTRERGAFDPELFADLSKSSAEEPSASPFSGADVLHPVTTAGDAGAKITLPVGTELSASVIAQKQETNSSFASLNPEYDATTQLAIRQPLLQGFGPAARGNLDQARRAYEAEKHRYEDAIADVRASTEESYWDLYAAERNLAATRLNRDRATSVLSEVGVKAKAGLIGPNQVNNAKVFLAQAEQDVMDADDDLNRVSDHLGSLIGRRPDAPFVRFKAVDDPPVNLARESEDSLVTKAMTTNHQVLAAEADVNAAQALVRAANWNALPTADFFATLGGNGLAGMGQEVIFLSDTLTNTRRDRLGDALNQAFRRDFPTWTVGLHLSVPILLRGRRGERERLEGELFRSQVHYLEVKR